MACIGELVCVRGDPRSGVRSRAGCEQRKASMAPYISQHGDNPDLTSHTLGQLRIRSLGKWGDAVISSRRKPFARKDVAQSWELLWFREDHKNRSWSALQCQVLYRRHMQSQADHRNLEVVLAGPLTVTLPCLWSLTPSGHRHPCIIPPLPSLPLSLALLCCPS